MSKTSKTADKVPMAVPAGGEMEIPLARIRIDSEFNVRQTNDEEAIKLLSKSLESEGQIQSIVVEPTEDGHYMVIAGHRRVAAAKLLEWESIRATIWTPTDAKGQPLTDEKEIAVARYFVNMAENVARKDVTPFDLASRCKLLKRKYELKGDQIAKRLAKNTGYVNNLLAIMGEGEKGEHAGNTLAPPILARWREECSWPESDMKTKFCQINTLRSWVRLDHDTQLARFNEEMFVADGGDREKYRENLKAANGTSAAGAGAGEDAKEENAVRASKKEIEAAIEAAKRAKKAKSVSKDQITRLNGVIDALQFALGVKKGLTNRITGVCAFKDGVMTEGAPPKEEKESSAN